jgi:hypothetical protein
MFKTYDWVSGYTYEWVLHLEKQMDKTCVLLHRTTTALGDSVVDVWGVAVESRRSVAVCGICVSIRFVCVPRVRKFGVLGRGLHLFAAAERENNAND